MNPGSAAELGTAVAVFVSTNVDDIVLLAVLYADARLRRRAVDAGQALGMAALTAASILAAVAALRIPAGWPALLGVLPLGIGCVALVRLRGGGSADDDDAGRRAGEAGARRGLPSQVVAVTAIVIANGGDNLGVYIPLFAASPASVPFFTLVFAVLTAGWCLAGRALVRHPAIRARASRYGQILLPVVLIALGGVILWDARVLLD